MLETSIDGRLKNLIHELEFNNAEEIIKGSLITEILYRISGFSDEIESFEKKYNSDFNEFKKDYEDGEEEFGKYDDLMAWEFAQQ